jgi:AraC family L-rhamnose operon transcriptional activator RhaR
VTYDPVAESDHRLSITDGSPAYAARYRHEGFFPVHTHNFLEIAVVLRGEGVHHSLGGDQRLRTGDVLLLRPGTWHGYRDCCGLMLYNCGLTSEVLRRELSWARGDPLLSYLLWTAPYAAERRGIFSLHLDAADSGECVAHLEELDRLRLRPAAECRSDVVGRLCLFLGHLARAAAGPRGPGSLGGSTHPAVLRAMQLLEARPAHPWSLDELAAELHLHPSSLVRLFKKATGLPPMAYLTRYRVETAAELLLHTPRPVGEIAETVGWPDQNYFARRFKAHYGLTATTYRARLGPGTARVPPANSSFGGTVTHYDPPGSARSRRG